jgi:glycosyltransferase EpsD
MPKILFVSNTANFSKFNLPIIEHLKKYGCQVDYASMGEETVPLCDNQYTISMTRNPFTIKNFFGYRELRKILKSNNYDIIHCHTPTAGFLARIAAKKSRSRIIYTAHGFHFYRGAPFYFWLIYYPIEKYLARFTDCLITVNHEDFEFAQKYIDVPILGHIDGVGVDLQRFYPASKTEKHDLRKKNGILR